MGKKVKGQKIRVRHGATYDFESDTCNDPELRGVIEVTITKIFSHGIKTKEIGYVNNSRIII